MHVGFTFGSHIFLLFLHLAFVLQRSRPLSLPQKSLIPRRLLRGARDTDVVALPVFFTSFWLRTSDSPHFYERIDRAIPKATNFVA
jgi:hypothetical protein